MKTFRRIVLIACAALLLVVVFASDVQARHGSGGFFFPFWAGPYYEPSPWRHRYYAPPRKRYHAPPRKRKVIRSERRRLSRSANRRAALAIAKDRRAEGYRTTGALPISCEKAQGIVAEFGFKEIRTELCTGESFAFHATRDNKPFLIEIDAASGELAKVRRLR
jgi:hypothetical protein